MEDQALWHERDISHSSVERIALPGATILLHYMLVKLRGLVDGLVVRPERMAENIERGLGLHASSRLLTALLDERRAVARGGVRHRPADTRCAPPMSAAPSGSCVEADPAVTAVLPPDAARRPASTIACHLRHAATILARLDALVPARCRAA